MATNVPVLSTKDQMEIIKLKEESYNQRLRTQMKMNQQLEDFQQNEKQIKEFYEEKLSRKEAELLLATKNVKETGTRQGVFPHRPHI